ncbi:MAG: RhuM family protein [Akkermansia sp.]
MNKTNNQELNQKPRGEILLYSSEDGKINLEIALENETLWLTQAQMSQLFQTTVQNITMHVKNIYQDNELQQVGTCKDFLQVRQEGTRTVNRNVDAYNLDMIIAVGYRVNSIRGTQFRIWATQRLSEYLEKGFVMDDERLKNLGGGIYFDQLLERIRDIRSSEKVFWRKVLDIYALSIDYTPKSKQSTHFFQTMQNKMHWAASGHTAAEIIYARADADKPYMGLTTASSNHITKADTQIAKNYMTEEELTTLNGMVSSFLEYAEVQAKRHVPMYMQDWINKLDSFVELFGGEILNGVGKISHDIAIQKATREYESYHQKELLAPSRGELDYLDSIVCKVQETIIPYHSSATATSSHQQPQQQEQLYEGKFLRLIKEGKWEYVDRVRANGAVMIVALTPERELLLVEEFRVPLHAYSIGLPAGISGDEGEEAFIESAKRELLEESGYIADTWRHLFMGSSCPGLTTEMVAFYVATNLHRITEGGGVDNENITVHRIPLNSIHSWLFAQINVGKIVDPKIFMGLYFLGQLCPSPITNPR